MAEPHPSAYRKGDIIGNTYEVLGLLGEGGCGVVYAVTSQGGGEIRALKTFRDVYICNPGARRSFEKEALTWVQLGNHPFILSAHCVREFSGRLFVEMDFVPPDSNRRITLHDHLQSGKPMRPERTLEWAIQFCIGMEHAVAHGIACHRDIKPANILIHGGALKISDFGLAAAASEVTFTMGGIDMQKEAAAPTRGVFTFSILETDGKARCGTPGYMPPEVYREDGADVRSDIYSFGLVIWQMASGSPLPPFVENIQGDLQSFMREVYKRQMAGRVPPISEPLRAVVERCLHPDAAGRFANFTQLREALEPLYLRVAGGPFVAPSKEDQSATFWNNKGMSLAALGRKQEAIECYDKALALSPREAKIWSNKGLALQESEWLEEALYCYDRALTLDPKLDGTWSNKATTLDALGRHAEAAECHGKGLTLDSKSAAMWNNSGVAHSSNREFKRAIECFDKAVAIDPRYAEAWNNRGVALAGLGNHQDAIKSYHHAIVINPQYSEALYNIALSLSASGQSSEALRFFDAALEANPNDPSVWYDKANRLDALGRYEDAINCYTEALRINPQYLAAWNNKGGTFVNMRRFSEAIQCYDAAIAIDPSDARRWFNKAYAEEQIGRSNGSIGSYTRFIQMAPPQYAEQIDYARRRIRELQGR